MPEFRPIGWAELVTGLTDRLTALPVAGVALRVAIDGADATDPGRLADSLLGPLLARSRVAVHLQARYFWRDASLRLEYGRHDLQSFANDWLDVAALCREVLDPLGPGGSGLYLPSLRDPASNRATRATAQQAAPATIVLVSGSLLLRHPMPFDARIHLAMSAPALTRHTTPDQLWTLPAFAEYEAEVRPSLKADVIVRLDDPNRPAANL